MYAKQITAVFLLGSNCYYIYDLKQELKLFKTHESKYSSFQGSDAGNITSFMMPYGTTGNPKTDHVVFQLLPHGNGNIFGSKEWSEFEEKRSKYVNQHILNLKGIDVPTLRKASSRMVTYQTKIFVRKMFEQAKKTIPDEFKRLSDDTQYSVQQQYEIAVEAMIDDYLKNGNKSFMNKSNK